MRIPVASLSLIIAVSTFPLACDGPGGTDPPPTDPAAVESTSQALVSPAFPAVIPGVLPDATAFSWAGLPIPDGPPATPAVPQTRGAQYLTGPSLAVAPAEANDAWADGVALDGRTDAAPAAFRARLGEALTGARTAIGAGPTGVEEILGPGVRAALEAAGLSIDPASLAFVPRSYGFTGERARWIKGSTIPPPCTGVPICPFPETRLTHATPASFDELRQRGARLYCAAREAFRRQPAGTTVMGRQALAHVDVLGTRIDIMRVEPTLTLNAPRVHTTADPDGAQAFAIPFTVGTRIQPISLLPSLPELRVPVTMVTADGEQSNRTRLPSEGGPILPRPRGTRDWQTVTHADAFLTGQRGLKASTEIPLLALGPATLTLMLGVDARVGDSSILPGKLLRGVPGVPARRGGWTDPAATTWPRHNDASWRLDPPFFHGANVPVWVPSVDTVLPALALAARDPFLVRANQDNDKALRVASSLGVSAGLKAGLFFPPGCTGGCFLNIGFYGLIELTGTAAQSHLIRERLELTSRDVPGAEFPPPVPETFLTVTPESRAVLDLRGAVGFMFKLRLGLFDIDLGFPIIDHTGRLAEWGPVEWQERNRLRIGSGSALGDVSAQPDVFSHWPSRGDFASFPAPVSACVTTPPDEDVPRHPCGSTGGTPGGPPTTPVRSAEICAYYPTFATGEFGPARTPAQEACIDDVLAFVRGGVSRNQSYRHSYDGSLVTHPVTARVMATRDYDAYLAMANRCAAAFPSARDLRELVLFVAPCTASAWLLSPAQLVNFGSGTGGAPPPVTPDPGVPGRCE